MGLSTEFAGRWRTVHNRSWPVDRVLALLLAHAGERAGTDGDDHRAGGLVVRTLLARVIVRGVRQVDLPRDRDQGSDGGQREQDRQATKAADSEREAATDRDQRCERQG